MKTWHKAMIAVAALLVAGGVVWFSVY